VTDAEARSAWEAMSTAQRDAMASAAPDFAGAWQSARDEDNWIRGRDWDWEQVVARVTLSGRAFVERAFVASVSMDRTVTQLGKFRSIELAQAACDAALRADEWALEP